MPKTAIETARDLALSAEGYSEVAAHHIGTLRAEVNRGDVPSSLVAAGRALAVVELLRVDLDGCVEQLRDIGTADA